MRKPAKLISVDSTTQYLVQDSRDLYPQNNISITEFKVNHVKVNPDTTQYTTQMGKYIFPQDGKDKHILLFGERPDGSKFELHNNGNVEIYIQLNPSRREIGFNEQPTREKYFLQIDGECVYGIRHSIQTLVNCGKNKWRSNKPDKEVMSIPQNIIDIADVPPDVWLLFHDAVSQDE